MNFNAITANILNVGGDIWVNTAKYDVKCLKTVFCFSFPSQKKSDALSAKKKRKRKNQSQYVFFKISQPCIDNHLSACLKYSDALFSQASIEQSAVKT